MRMDKSGVHKTMSGAGINKSRKFRKEVRNKGRGKGNTEGVGIGKSGRIEAEYLRGCTGRSNAVLSLCGGLRLFSNLFFVFLLSLDSMGLGFGGGQGRLWAILGSVSGSATEHAEVVFKMVLVFLQGELSVLSELVRECGRISGGGRLARVVTGVLIVLVLRFVRIARVVAGVLVARFLSDLSLSDLSLSGLFFSERDFSQRRL